MRRARARLYAAAALSTDSTVETADVETTAGFGTLRAALATRTRAPRTASGGAPSLPEAA